MMHTPKQSYIIIFLLVIATLGAGVWFYTSVESLNVIDSLYLSVMTLTTVGYGDIAPTTDAGKLFTSFYVLIGVGIIGIFIRAIIQGAGEKFTAQSSQNHIRNHEHHLHE